MVLVQNWPFFHVFMLGNIDQENVLHDILEGKTAFLDYVLVQNWPFLHVFLLRNIGEENVFHNILEEKTAFLCYKNRKLKKLKN